jgi:hypothetical protein
VRAGGYWCYNRPAKHQTIPPPLYGRSTSLIAFHDFVPQRQGKRYLGVVTDYENLHELVIRVNLWIEQHHIDVLNVETVVVTSLPKETEASPKLQMGSQGDATSAFQIVQVWYRETVGVEAAYTGQTMRLSTE